MLLAGAQLAVITRDQLTVIHVAREAARAASVSTLESDGTTAGLAASELTDVSVSVSTDGARVTASVSRVVRTTVPLVGRLLPDITVRATATMQVEPS